MTEVSAGPDERGITPSGHAEAVFKAAAAVSPDPLAGAQKESGDMESRTRGHM